MCNRLLRDKKLTMKASYKTNYNILSHIDYISIISCTCPENVVFVRVVPGADGDVGELGLLQEGIRPILMNGWRTLFLIPYVSEPSTVRWMNILLKAISICQFYYNLTKVFPVLHKGRFTHAFSGSCKSQINGSSCAISCTILFPL
jgi:hypothetical protein